MRLDRFTSWNFRRGDAEKQLSRFALAFAVLSVVVHGAPALAQSASAAEPQPSIVHVDATPGHAINSFDPDSALGSSIDVLSHDAIDEGLYPAHH